MSPSEVARLYLSERVVSNQYEQQLTRVSSHLAEFSAAVVNAYLRSRLSSLTNITVQNERRMIRTLWQFAYDNDIVASPPRAILRIPQHNKPVEAWSVDDVKVLVKSALDWQGEFRCGVEKSLFLRTWVLLAYETGARYGDIFSWTDRNIRNGAMQWTIRKTGVSCCRALSADAEEAAREMLAARRRAGLRPRRDKAMLILGALCCRRYSFTVMRQLLEKCGLPGSGKFLRRSSATHVEMQFPGAAQAFLGHRSPGMAARHYLDQSQLQASVVRPPSVID